MGRWGNKIYESDKVLDVFDNLQAQIKRELVFWLQPEQLPIQNAGYRYWVANVLSVIEMMLLFGQHEQGNPFQIEHPAAVNRWRKVFLGVWDGNWDDTDPAVEAPQGYAVPAYRQQHRAAVVAMFDRLESIAHMWANIDQPTAKSTLLAPLLPEYPLPYFSNPHSDNSINAKRAHFLGSTLEGLVMSIVYWLSSEMRPFALMSNVEEVWGAVDILGFLCKAYDVSPIGRIQTIQSWQETTILIWKQFQANCKQEWKEGELYHNVIAAFDRLKDTTNTKQPDSDWLYSWYDSLNLES